MTAAILEIRDEVAVGPLHQPVPMIGRNTLFDDEAFDWPTLCGVRGHAYQREALAALGHTSECFECAVEALKLPARKPEPELVDRSARPCKECRERFTPGPRSTRKTRFCSRRCYQRWYQRANAETLRPYHRDWMRQIRGTVEPFARACEWCGGLFTQSILGPRNGRRFCCGSCRAAAFKARKKAA